MPEATKHRNADAWWGLLLAVGALAANVAFFAYPPLQSMLPWLSLVLAVAALLILARGLRRAFGQAEVYRGKALSVILGVATLAVAGLMIFAFFQARALPGSADAPQVGQPAPDFTLTDTSGKAVSLDSLIAAPGEPQSAAPKAVLLIFYRGYW